MGSDRHYPEEAPVHRVAVEGFWIDRTPVTNADFHRFAHATGYITFAEIAPQASEADVDHHSRVFRESVTSLLGRE